MRYLIYVSFLFSVFSSKAQELLTWEGAVEVALQKNYGLKVMRNQAEMEKNLNHAGNAGYLPTVDVGASQNWTSNDVRLEFFSGDVNEVSGAKSNSTNAFVELNWTFFDGFRMFATDKMLDYRQEYVEVSLKAEIDLLLFQMAGLYAEGVRLQQDIKSLEKNVAFSNFRYDLLQKKLDAGSGIRSELIQAELDKNNDEAQIIRTESQLLQVKYDFIRTIGFEAADAFVFDSTFVLDIPIDFQEASMVLDSLNKELLMAKIQASEVEMRKKIAQSEYYPQLGVNAAYNFSTSTSEAGVLFSNRSLGPSLTLNLRWNVFGSFNRIKNVQNAQLEMESAELFQKQIRFTKEIELKKYYETYGLVQRLYNKDLENIEKAEQQIAIAKEAFQSGKIDALQLREIQMTIQQLERNLNESQMQKALSQANIVFLTGSFQYLSVE